MALTYLSLIMAKILPNEKFTIFILFLLTLFIKKECYKFSENLSPKSFGLKNEKLTHLHFYFQDILSGNNPTAIRVAQAAMTNTSKTSFGATVVIDDPLTIGPERTSKIVGRAQGIYAFADLNKPGLFMAMSCVFTEGEHNGSSLSILGHNPFLLPIREMLIVGGSGIYRFARGYALVKTSSINSTSGDAVAEFDVYVLHYGK